MSRQHKHILVCTVITLFLPASVRAADNQPNDIALAKSFPVDTLRDILIPHDQWRPFPLASDRQAWKEIATPVRQRVIQQAQDVAGMDIPALPASVYLQYQRNGNRNNYQDIWFERRARLHVLVAAECLENKRRFLDPITDAIWAICEESSWTFPAHIGPQKAGSGLPDVDDQVVALFSAQTANSLVLTSYLLSEQLDAVSPLIRPRIAKEVDRRILTPFLTKEFGWMGYAARRNKHYPNNWNPWICSNVLLSALLSEQDDLRRAQLVHKGLDCLDNFLTYYPHDGSCDEGPSYWGRAGASVFDAFEYLYSATNHRFNYYQHPLIKEMARFIYRAHIVDDYFICLGDCDARFQIANELVYRFGKRIGDEHLQALGAYGVNETTLLESVKRNYDLNRYLHLLLNGTTLTADDPPTRPMVQDMWLAHPTIQMMAARDHKGSAEGLFVAAWGGHNAQSHNHNDVGNFVIFADGKPMLIDIGRPTYRRQTFSSRRYEIWAFQSGFHNLPTINGVDQKAGRQFAAKQVTCQQDQASSTLTMNIASAYPKTAGVASWQRSIRLNRDKDVEVVDVYTFNVPSSDIIENFIVAGKVTQAGSGKLILHSREHAVQMHLDYDAAKLSADIETITLEDAKLKQMWGEALYRIRLKTKQKTTSGQLTFRFSNVK
jgi:hypothetical protein